MTHKGSLEPTPSPAVHSMQKQARWSALGTTEILKCFHPHGPHPASPSGLPPTPTALRYRSERVNHLGQWGCHTPAHGSVPEPPISLNVVNFSPQFQECQQETCQSTLVSSLSSARTLSRKTGLNQGFQARKDRRIDWKVKNSVNLVTWQLVHLEIIHWSG